MCRKKKKERKKEKNALDTVFSSCKISDFVFFMPVKVIREEKQLLIRETTHFCRTLSITGEIVLFWDSGEHPCTFYEMCSLCSLFKWRNKSNDRGSKVESSASFPVSQKSQN